MEAFEYAIKKDVRNNPIVREVDEERQRDLWKSVGVAGILAPAGTFSSAVVQQRSGLPSMRTVQAPHWPSSQQILQPVSSICSRSTVASVAAFSATTWRPI